MNSKVKTKKNSAERLFARYKTYEGQPGNTAQWRSLAERVLSSSPSNNLALLGLTGLPSSLDELKQARRKAMVIAHPDKGGSEDQAAKINGAFEVLSKMFPEKIAAFTSDPTGLQHPARCTSEVPDYMHGHFVAEEKINGERFLLYFGFDPYGRRTGNTLLSRHKSKSDRCYCDRSDSAAHITGKVYIGLEHTVLDGEIFNTDLETTGSIMRSSNNEGKLVTYYVFDILVHKGKDVKNLPLEARREIVQQVVAQMANPHVKLLEQYASNFDSHFDRIVTAGGEGLVVKDLRLGYGQGWSKMKKTADVSCIVTGWKPGKKALEGMVGSWAVSVYDGDKLVEVGFVSGFTNELREDITNNFDDYLGTVIDVFAFELTKANRLRNPTFHRIRRDVTPEDCTLEKLKDDMSKIRKNRKKM